MFFSLSRRIDPVEEPNGFLGRGSFVLKCPLCSRVSYRCDATKFKRGILTIRRSAIHCARGIIRLRRRSDSFDARTRLPVDTEFIFHAPPAFVVSMFHQLPLILGIQLAAIVSSEHPQRVSSFYRDDREDR